MKYKFFSADYGALVFGRRILKKNPSAELEFFVKDKIEMNFLKGEKVLCERDFWDIAIETGIQKSRFGRVGIFLDRENFVAKKFFDVSNLEKFKKTYQPKNRRSEKNLKISVFEIQLLKKMANEDWADSVEFRRIARKFLRQTKNANIDTILFADAIFGSEAARKVLQHLAGKRIKCVFLSDCLMCF